MQELEQFSTIKCPVCGFQQSEIMPTDACLYFYDCGASLKPKRGDCCVFCSWGSVPCPPMQAVCDRSSLINESLAC
jgi:hypothetical protein